MSREAGRVLTRSANKFLLAYRELCRRHGFYIGGNIYGEVVIYPLRGEEFLEHEVEEIADSTIGRSCSEEVVCEDA